MMTTGIPTAEELLIQAEAKLAEAQKYEREAEIAMHNAKSAKFSAAVFKEQAKKAALRVQDTAKISAKEVRDQLKNMFIMRRDGGGFKPFLCGHGMGSWCTDENTARANLEHFMEHIVTELFKSANDHVVKAVR